MTTDIERSNRRHQSRERDAECSVSGQQRSCRRARPPPVSRLHTELPLGTMDALAPNRGGAHATAPRLGLRPAHAHDLRLLAPGHRALLSQSSSATGIRVRCGRVVGARHRWERVGVQHRQQRAAAAARFSRRRSARRGVVDAAERARAAVRNQHRRLLHDPRPQHVIRELRHGATQRSVHGQLAGRSHGAVGSVTVVLGEHARDDRRAASARRMAAAGSQRHRDQLWILAAAVRRLAERAGIKRGSRRRRNPDRGRDARGVSPVEPGYGPLAAPSRRRFGESGAQSESALHVDRSVETQRYDRPSRKR